MKTTKLLSCLCLLGVCAPASASQITFDIGSGVGVTGAGGMDGNVSQTVGDFELITSFPQANANGAFGFVGANAPLFVNVTLNNNATAETNIPFNLDSITVANANTLESIDVVGINFLIGDTGTDPTYVASADFSTQVAGNVVVTTDNTGTATGDTLINFLQVRYFNDAEPMGGVDFPAFNNIVVSVVPEPASAALLGLMTAGALLLRRR